MIIAVKGIAVAMVFKITSKFLTIVMIMIWETNVVLVLAYVVLTLILWKFVDGGYLSLLFAVLMAVIMFGFVREIRLLMKSRSFSSLMCEDDNYFICLHYCCCHI